MLLVPLVLGVVYCVVFITKYGTEFREFSKSLDKNGRKVFTTTQHKPNSNSSYMTVADLTFGMELDKEHRMAINGV